MHGASGSAFLVHLLASLLPTTTSTSPVFLKVSAPTHFPQLQVAEVCRLTSYLCAVLRAEQLLCERDTRHIHVRRKNLPVCPCMSPTLKAADACSISTPNDGLGHWNLHKCAASASLL